MPSSRRRRAPLSRGAIGALVLVALVAGGIAVGYKSFSDQVADDTANVSQVEPSAGEAEQTFSTPEAAGELLDQRNRPWVVSVLGDSTGNGPDEWVYLTFTRLAEAVDRPLVVHDWSVETNTYEGETRVREGDAAPIVVWNGSASGMGTSYSNDFIGELQPEKPDLLVVNHGHNQASDTQAVAGVDALKGATAQRWDEPWPAVAIVLQNPRFDASENVERQAEIVSALRETFGRSKDPLLLVDVFEAFTRAPEPEALVYPEDRFHPNGEGEQVWADAAWAALAPALLDQ